MTAHDIEGPNPGDWVASRCWCDTRDVSVPIELVREGLTISHDQDQTCRDPRGAAA